MLWLVLRTTVSTVSPNSGTKVSMGLFQQHARCSTTKDTISLLPFAIEDWPTESGLLSKDDLDPNKGEDSNLDKTQSAILSGTTLRVYRFLYREGKPMNIHDVQRGLNLSSASVAQYHIRSCFKQGSSKNRMTDSWLIESFLRIWSEFDVRWSRFR